MEFIKDSLFRVYAVCCQQLHRPLRVHIKYSVYPTINVHTEDLCKSIRDNFGVCEVTITKERAPFLENNYEIWVVGGPLLWSRRNGQGCVDSDEKRETIVEGIKKALVGSCPPSCCCCSGGNGPCKSIYEGWWDSSSGINTSCQNAEAPSPPSKPACETCTGETPTTNPE